MMEIVYLFGDIETDDFSIPYTKFIKIPRNR